ncbi:MAG TPA: DUF4252 domain-containing protein [Bryobacteraceae bacterium]|jgi:hypothetical protein|nr:DUF4252 domain-containing protein [Bryobacteraceae bacterium]
MKKAFLLLAAAIPALAQQNFDFKTLDKLGAKAKESTNITLDNNTLRLALGFLGDGENSLKSLAGKLKGIYVRSYEFDKPGQYNEADLAPLRAYVKSLQWTKIVDVKEQNETSEIYILGLPNDKLGGLAIISVEPMEVTVVFINGALDMSDIGKLSGNLGIPDLPSVTGGNGKKSGSKSGNSNKRDNDDKD